MLFLHIVICEGLVSEYELSSGAHIIFFKLSSMITIHAVADFSSVGKPPQHNRQDKVIVFYI